MFASDIVVSKFLFLKKKKEFSFQNKKLAYFYHAYNKTWKNERAIEIPVFLEYIRNAKPKEMLEIGHVIGHYVTKNHQVLDKFEKQEGILNEDVEFFKPRKEYDCIISVSTMEHVGIDDSPQDKEKAARSLKHLKKILTKEGKIFISFPANYNPSLMKLIEKSKNITVTCFKRINKSKNIWAETNYSEIKNVKSKDCEAVIFLEITSKTKLSQG